VLHCVYLFFHNGAVVQTSIGPSDNDQLFLREPIKNIPLPCIRRKWRNPKFPRKTTPCRLQTFQYTCWACPLYTCHDSNCLSCPSTIRFCFLPPHSLIYLSSTTLQMEAVSSPTFGIYNISHKTTSVPRDCLLTRVSPLKANTAILRWSGSPNSPVNFGTNIQICVP
jgi:hypothetical protein